MHKKSLKKFRNSFILTLIIGCIAIGFIQVVNEDPNIGRSLSNFIFNHKLAFFVFRAFIAVLLFFLWPFLIANMKNAHPIEKYNKLISFRWAVLGIFILVETLQAVG